MPLLPLRSARRLALACLAPFLCTVSHRGLAEEAPFFEDLPTVLSASRLPQALNEAPGAVTILDREFIQATGYRDIARLLRLVPGMQIGQERGHSQWVTYHGLGSDYPTEIQVLVDGRSVYSPSAFGGVDWSALPLTLQEIERIEVVRGTNSNAYGANAFLGVINIITRHSHQERGASAQVTAGNRGIRDQHASWTGGGDGLGVRLSAAQLQDKGFQNLNDDRSSQTVTLRSDYRLNGLDEVSLWMGYNRLERGMGYQDSLYGNNAERTAGSESATFHLSWRRTLSADEEWLVNFYRNQENSRDRWRAAAPGYADVPLDRSRSSHRTNLEIQHRLALNAHTRLVWGLEARRDHSDAPGLFAGGKPPRAELYRAFSNLDWRITPNWQLNLGGLLEKNGDVVPQFIPRVFVNWQAGQGHTFRAGYARAWQQRNLFELYGDVRAYSGPGERSRPIAWPYVPNPNLRTPRVDTVEVGYLGRLPSMDSTLDIRIFNERIADFVVRENTTSPIGALAIPLPSSRFVNLDSSIVLRGIEYQLRTRPRPGTELLFSHSLIDRQTDDPQMSKRAAPYAASFTWLQNYGNGWRSTASLLRMGPLAGGYGYVPGCDYLARAYTSLDLRLAKSFRMEGRRVDMAINGINLGERHQEIADRSEQCLSRNISKPANPAASTVWLSVAVEL
ncbi:TonB-dependent receptor [Zoogloea sp.]|uniref:TonB-dependent receptor plug domain-containing protein n=1 Tax=Zoogloea sp. TaxID=49181 RepID=UPI0026238827|nr:TonB-dependent receptor [Zoogloea sp.]MDD3352692.1 TonB-dependent receptor [Zoogloea sp.]